MTPDFDADSAAHQALIGRLETYYDAVPRSWADTEEVGPFTLFVAREGWPYYARPTLGGSTDITADDVHTVLARQRELDVPQAIEWVDEVTPGLAQTVAGLDVDVEHCPLMVLSGPPVGDPGTARVLGAHEVADLEASRRAVSVAFATGGTATGEQGIEARDASDDRHSPITDAFLARIASERLRQAAIWAPDAIDVGPVGGGSHTPTGIVTELAGVGVLPAYRRRGLAAKLTYLLTTDALARGVETVFCSAQTEDVARVYTGIGFQRVGTACIAER
jgi:ribosomal protein S18 acetylase RimI-like enzyme